MRCVAAVVAASALVGACGGPGGGSVGRPLGEGPDSDYMNAVMQVRADAIWSSVGTAVTAEGVRRLTPKTDAGWAQVVSYAEAVTDAGSQLEAVDWAPRDGSWAAYTRAVVRAGERARVAAQAHDEDGVLDAGEQLHDVCAACHKLYRVGEFAPAAEKGKS